MHRNHQSPRRVLIAAALMGYLAGGAQAGPQDTLQQVVSELGRLNGIALACGQNALTARMREILIDVAPKQRDVGASYEEATSESFVTFGQSGEACPDGRTLAGRIEAAQGRLRLAVGAAP